MEKRELQLKALSDETRLRIVRLLLKQNLCVGALAKTLSLSEAAISQHLSVLYRADLVLKEKRGYFMHYDVNKNELLELSDFLAQLAKTQKQACEETENQLCKKKECHSGNCKCKKP